MTETEWLAATDPTPMLRFLAGKTSDRKLRLFACSCCLRLPKYKHEAIDRMIPTVGDFADGIVRLPKMNKLRSIKLFRFLTGEPCQTMERVKKLLLSGKSSLLSSAEELSAIVGRLGGAAVPSLITELFGNPFRPVPVDPNWLTSTVVAARRWHLRGACLRPNADSRRRTSGRWLRQRRSSRPLPPTG